MTDRDTIFTEEVLREQHGRKTPVTNRPGGEVIGEATMRYDEETGNLYASYRIDDPKYKELDGSESLIFRKES
jgi:hypothetical protein